jgi:2,3-bisphosphoglycerate-dependent phosphoglycerate mutase
LNRSRCHIYLIRHCAAAGQDPAAALTAIGCEQAILLADALTAAGIERIVCSPFRRAQDSIEPLAYRLGIPIEIDDRLAERRLGRGFDDWRRALQATFDDHELCFVDGESSAAATARGIAAIDNVLDSGRHVTAVVTHGNLMALLLRHFNPGFGYTEWERLTNPDVYRVSITNGEIVTERIWH